MHVVYACIRKTSWCMCSTILVDKLNLRYRTGVRYTALECKLFLCIIYVKVSLQVMHGKYSIRGMVEWRRQHKLQPSAIFWHEDSTPYAAFSLYYNFKVMGSHLIIRFVLNLMYVNEIFYVLGTWDINIPIYWIAIMYLLYCW